jgi:hypothetical protein
MWDANQQSLSILAIRPEEATQLWLYNGGDHPFLPEAERYHDYLQSLSLTECRSDDLFLNAGTRISLTLKNRQVHDPV